jgi:hypothetical protein
MTHVETAKVALLVVPVRSVSGHAGSIFDVEVEDSCMFQHSRLAIAINRPVLKIPLFSCTRKCSFLGTPRYVCPHFVELVHDHILVNNQPYSASFHFCSITNILWQLHMVQDAISDAKFLTWTCDKLVSAKHVLEGGPNRLSHGFCKRVRPSAAHCRLSVATRANTVFSREGEDFLVLMIHSAWWGGDWLMGVKMAEGGWKFGCLGGLPEL